MILRHTLFYPMTRGTAVIPAGTRCVPIDDGHDTFYWVDRNARWEGQTDAERWYLRRVGCLILAHEVRPA